MPVMSSRKPPKNTRAPSQRKRSSVRRSKKRNTTNMTESFGSKEVSKKGSLEFRLNEELDSGSVKTNDKHSSHVWLAKSFTGHEDRIDQASDSSSQYDTDLDIEVVKAFVPYTSRSVYLGECRRLGIRPNTAVLRSIDTEVLHVRHNQLGPSDAKAISRALFENMTVKTLDLKDNILGSGGAKQIAAVLKINVYITDVNLAENNIGGFGLLALADVLASNETVNVLNIAGNGFKDDHANYVLQLLTENFRIHSLDISNNRFGQCAAPILGQALLSNDTLRVLNLSHNQLGKLHTDKFMAAFKERSNLKEIDLSWNGLGNPGAKGIGVYLAQNAEVTILDISNNNITPVGAEFIAKGMKNNVSLVTLRMGQNPIGTAGALSILTMISKNERSVLQMLDLKDVWVTIEFHDIFNELRRKQKIEVVVGGIIEDFQHRPQDLTEMMAIKEKAAKDIEEKLKAALQNDPFISLVYHMDENEIPTDQFAAHLPVDRRLKTVHLGPFKQLLEESKMPDELLQKIIKKFRYKEDKFFIEKFRKEFHRAVVKKRKLVSNIGEMPVDEEGEEGMLDDFPGLDEHMSETLSANKSSMSVFSKRSNVTMGKPE